MIKVESVNINAKCWVVRPGVRYRYSSEFIDGGFVAMGHMDGIINQKDRGYLNFNDLQELESKYTEISKLTVNVTSQINSFIFDMNVGDVVFTMTPSLIIPGIIKSDAYYDPKTIKLQQKTSETFSIRRTVEWGTPIKRSEIPLKFIKSFNAYQAIFSLGDFSKEIYHWLSSFFISGDGFYSSLRIEQPDSINHHALKMLSEVIDRIQVLSLLLENISPDDKINIDLAMIQEHMERMSDEGLLNLTAQQMLMSPGDFWLGLKTGSKRSGVAFILLMAMIVSDSNVSFAGTSYQSEEVIARELVTKHGAVVMEGINMAKIKKQLELGVGKQNKKFVEANPNDYEESDAPDNTDPKIVGS